MPFTPLQRRLFLLGGLIGFVGLTRAVPALLDRFADDFDFTDLASPKGFRSFAGGEVSQSFDPFVGLGGTPSGRQPQPVKDVPKTLFPSVSGPGRVQLAYFSDFYCPYCRVLSQDLIGASEELPIDISWHETPIFGSASELAAKGALAAAAQGGYVRYHLRMVRTPVVVTRDYLQRLAAGIGLDAALFMTDLDSPVTQAALDRAQDLAALFAFPGTPGLVVGRTVVVGSISPTNLRQLIAREQADGHVS